MAGIKFVCSTPLGVEHGFFLICYTAQMSSVFFYTIGIGFASGIFIRSFFDIGLHEIFFLLLVSVSLALVWRLEARTYHSLIFMVSLAIFCFALGALRLEIADKEFSPLEMRVDSQYSFEGVVIQEPDIRTRSVHLYIKVEEVDELILVTTDRYQSFAYGDHVLVTGVLLKPESFETDLGRTFNYPGYLQARGVLYTMQFAEVGLLESGGGNILLRSLFKGKSAFIDVVERVIPEPQAGLSEGLLLGVKRALGEDLEDVFRRTGIIHIVVLSGYNVMIVAEAIMRFLSFFFSPRIRLTIGIIGIGLFALLVGLSATVVRASVMAVLVLVARATGRIYAILRALMLAGVFMLLINPYLLVYDPGFQLSFLATLGLILLAPLLEIRLGLVPTTFQIREFLTATIATQIFVLPLLLYLMGTFSFVSVFVNVLVLPMVPIAMLLTFAVGSIGFFVPFLGMVIGYGAYLSLSYIIIIAEQFAKIPFAAISVSAFPFWLVVISYVLMGYGLVLLSKKEDPDIPIENDATDDYSDWMIESEVEGVPKAQDASGMGS